MERKTKIAGNLLGHKGRCFDLRINPRNKDILLSSSEDGIAKLWQLSSKSCISSIAHNKETEVLRSAFMSNLVLTAGADGKVHIWESILTQIEKGPFAGGLSMHKCGTMEHDGIDSQIYVCEVNDILNSLLTAADSAAYLWDPTTCQLLHRWHCLPIDSNLGAFGGSRNPNNEVYIFDAKWNPSMPNVAIMVLSDSSIRFLDSRDRSLNSGSFRSISLCGDNRGVSLGHATSVNWNSSGDSCIVAFGSGYVTLFDSRKGAFSSALKLHQGPCYGASYLDSSHCISWSADSTIKKWNIFAENDGSKTIDSLEDYLKLDDMTIFSCCSLMPEENKIVCGGGFKGSKSASPFLGTPIYILEGSSEPL